MNSWYMKYAVMVLSSLAGYAAYQWVPWCKMGAAEWASWVQAVGSIAAIYAAFEVGRRQAEGARKEASEGRERLLRQRRDAVEAIVIHAQEQAAALHHAITRMPIEVFRFSLETNMLTVAEAASSIEAVPFHELGSAKAVTHLAGILSNLRAANAGAEKFAHRSATASDHASGLIYVTSACEMVEFNATRFLRENQKLF